MTSLSILNKIEKENLELTKQVNDIINIDFLTDTIKNVDNKKISFLNKTVNRFDTINKFASLIKDIDVSIKLEAGIFEFTLVYANTKGIIKNLLPSIYNDKVYEIMQNLDPNSTLENKTLISDINTGKMNPQCVAFLNPQQIHPEQWKQLVEKVKLKEEKKNSIATTDLYQCFKCKGRKCQMYMIQLRSSDEPMNRIITCLECGNVWKK